MDLSRLLKFTALILFIIMLSIQSSQARYHGRRQKRQYGAQLYLPESFIIPGGEGSNPSEWGPWSSPSECSRSCGGGVAYQTRECYNFAPNGASLCSGGNRKYFSCNTQDCPDDESDFRAQQCSRFNSVPFEGVRYEWIPYTKAPNPCELNCMPRGERFYYRHKAKVIDGTRCNDESLDVCVDGKCESVGCDMMLGSSAREDKCRKCAGDGSSCRTVSGLLDMNNLQVGYNDILLIPAGATNINIQEIAPSNNYLACRNLTGHYYLNGNWRIDFPRPMLFAGSWWHYERKPQGFAAPDHLTCMGPTTESIYIVLLYQDRNVGIEYEYSVPENAVKLTEQDTYSWTFSPFGPCSASCGGGFQTRNVTCHSRNTLEPVDSSLCDSTTKPADMQQCGQEECAPRWSEGQWGKCSKPCGQGGKQQRTVQCERVSSSGTTEIVDDSVCLELVGNKPATEQDCNKDDNCPKWHIGPWKPCSQLCGEGVQMRKVTCYKEEKGKKKIVSDSECPEEKPETEQACMLQPCEGVDWIMSPWSGCEECGMSVETRTAICGSKSGKVYNESFCSSEKPELKRPCKGKPCKYQWFTSEWSKCSAVCGKGAQSRIVICGQFDGKTVTPAEDDSKCNVDVKPENSQECEVEVEKCPGQWFVGPWSKCSKKCGGGERHREVVCLESGKPSSNCDSNSIEFSSEKCNTQPCEKDETIPVDGKTGIVVQAIPEEEEEEECEDEEDEDIFGVELFTPKTKEEIKISDGIDLDTQQTTESSLLTDELMLSDSTGLEFETVPSGGTTDTLGSTVEGSGDDTLSTEGSGDEMTSVTESSSTEGISSSSESTETTQSMETEVSGSTETQGSTEGTGSTEMSGSTEEQGSTEVSGSTEISGSTDVSETTPSGTTDVSGISETTSSGATDASSVSDTISSETTVASSVSDTTSSETTESTSSESSPSSSSTEESTTEFTSSTESTESTLSTESSMDTSSTISSDSTASDVSGTEESTTMGVSESSETTVQSESTSEHSTVTSSEETTVSSLDESTVTGTTLETSEVTTVSGTTGETETTSSPESTVEISTVSELTETTETTVSGSTEETQTTESAATESTETTVSGSTEETSSTESTVEVTTSSSESEETTIDIWSTTETGLTEFTSSGVFTELTTRKCKPKKKKVDCSKSEFGCCPDNKTLATGPFDEGCPIAKTCEETKFGCCPDGLSPAKGKNNKGCPKSLCAETLFGCCPDKYTPAEGEDNEGCPEPTTTTTVSGCAGSKYGCCPDGETEAKGPKNKGCEESTTPLPDGATTQIIMQMVNETESPIVPCEESEHGCCPDGKTTATGKDFEGCDIVDKENCSKSLYGCCADNRTSATGPDQKGCEPCAQEPFGCCPDGRTPAHGHNAEGCCLNTPYGCCLDNINAANGPNFEGCDCKYAPYGCCPDRRTSARGPNNDGCGCEYSEHGCCPDKITPARGENFEGCPCHTFQFGCCPDGITVAKGPHRYGCYCSQTEFKCCPDEVTPAKGPDNKGCTCLESKYGCCPDGITAAEGKNFEGCENVVEPEQKSCALQKDTGPCTNFTIKYFFDANYGGCTRFWYGGCEGNGNRFDTEAECESICANYEGKESCLLPKSTGPCAGYFKRFYFDSDRKQCLEFNYGGCMGNTNNFESLAECQAKCAVEESLPPCEQPVDRGPCAGNFERWYYDNETDTCKSFSYGGCKGNKNNYATEHACNYNCKKPGVLKESCTLPKETGECDGQHAKWYFSQYDNKCMPFYYTGCGGNKNNFYSLEQCEEKCPKSVAKDICEIPAEVGECTNYEARWYYDTKDKRCAQFYYGGCGGNENNFKDEDTCLQRCEKKPEATRPPEPPERPDEDFHPDSCFLDYEEGNCRDYQTRWYYNSAEGICSPFSYSGCGGNENNFASEEECDNSCAHVQSACSLRPIYGACNENHTRWYYDERDQRCHSFAFSGCQGNRNNFFTERECLEFCGQPSVESKPQPPVSYSICNEPVSAGNCHERILSWYYDNEKDVCQAFYYTGCDGNGNRFESREQCERQCGEYKGVDVCNEPVEPGPCDQWQTRFYYDQRYGSCLPFSYSGCEGNGNRFISMDECESLCIKHEEPRSGDNKEICLLPVETGECIGRATSSKRWHYDNSIGTCIAFIYSGCAGNQNNFRSYESCVDFCSNIDVRSDHDEIRTAAPDVCEIYEQECQTLRCPYGVQKTYAPEGCQRCKCENPCEGYRCPEGTTCVVDLSAGSSYETQFVPVCRETSKPGECPSLSTNTSRCSRECNTDADCRDESKCCNDGCGYICVRPAVPQIEITTFGPIRTPYPGEAPPALEEKAQNEVDVDSPAGSYAVLRCYATGYPPPSISWKRGQVVINTNQGRYVLTASGDLTIVQVHRSDSGTYVCVADNGLGTPVSREVNLRVSDARPTDAYIVGPRNASVIATLKQPATLRCPAGGHPSPIVSWWRGKERLPLVSSRFEVNRHYSLVFRSVELSDLGTYTCEAYSGRGRPASIQRTLKAIGPVYITNEIDRPYLKYIVDPPTTTTTQKTIPVYPYRPTRPPPRVIPQPVVVQVAPRQKPVSALLRRDQGNTYALGTDMVLYCDVDGYPQPNVTWTKDDIQLVPSNKIQITENPHRLVVYGLTSDDSGFYACTARNQFSFNTYKEQIMIEGIYIPPDCKDNQFFAKCDLIVKGHYCSNHYYAKFCCRACTLAGQIPVKHPNALV